MTTPALTLSDFDNKFSSIKAFVTPEVLSLINRSETMKEQIRTYQSDITVDPVVLDTESPNAASFKTPTPAQQGIATFGINVLNNPIAFIKALSHELGHYAVEGMDGVLGKARAVAYANGDIPAYEDACHLTEGMARLNTAKVIEEITTGTGLAEPLATWLPQVKDFVEYQSLHALLGETQLTPIEADRAIALALGESNKSATTSTSGGTVTYLLYCSATANTVINSGQSALIDPAPTVLGDEISANGSETSSIGVLDANDQLHTAYRDTEVAPGLHEQALDLDADGDFDSRELIYADGGINPLTTLQDIQSAENVLAHLYDLDLLDTGYYRDFTAWSTQLLVSVGNPAWVPDFGFDLGFDPIGAFYESLAPVNDPAPTIAALTPLLLDAAQQGLTVAALAGRDADADGKLSGGELAGLSLWSDLDENGHLDPGELQTPAQAGLLELRAADYPEYVHGNAADAGGASWTVPGPAEAVPDSHYRALRDGDDGNVYFVGGTYFSWVWQDSQIKINQNQPTYLIGTDGNDGYFDANYYAAYPQYFNINLLTHFLGGDGDDTVGGSIRADTIWGGTGNDGLLGYAGNDALYGEEGGDELHGQDGDDRLDGGIGNDLLFGEAGQDSLSGNDGNDELQGGAGNDRLYGEAGADKLFGQVGDDLLYGGEGDDILVGFTGTNEPKQTLDPGETDADHLYGGAGNDLLLGGLGDDWLDGGAGADSMEGGTGDDSYVVNSVNDSILEQPNAGHDTVTSSVNYLLNANIEDLRLLPGLEINGSGNARDNRITGNERANILDGITGADTLVGGAGDDTYYVDNLGDQTIEQAGEGTDTVQSTITTTLSANLENLILLDFTKPEQGMADGTPILVYGYPKANELDYLQGDAVPGYLGTCALTSIANLLTQAGSPTTEGEVVQRALENGWTVSDLAQPDYVLGGSNFVDQQNLLESYGIRNDLLAGYNEAGLANLLRSGRGAILAVNAGALWEDAGYAGNGGVNHVVTVTGVAYGEADGALMGFYLADSGRGKVSDMTRYVGIDEFRLAADVDGAYAIHTLEPLKLWDENVDGVGNALDNVLAGNRGDNLLDGAAGADTLNGGYGDDNLFGGDGIDTAIYPGARAGYAVAKVGAGWTVTDTNVEDGNDGTDSLTGIERVQFSDQALVLPLAGRDHNADGKSDILYRANASGTLLQHQMNGFAVGAAGWTETLHDPDWTVLGTGDYNGDGRSDILLGNASTGGLIEYQMNGAAASAAAWLAGPGAGFKVVGSGDYDGDGKSDLLYRSSASGALLLHQMNGFAVSAAAWLPTLQDVCWTVVGNGDYNGDGKSDILLGNPRTGELIEYQMNGLVTSAAAWIGSPGVGFKVVGSGDYDGDGKSDILFRADASGGLLMHQMDGFAIANAAWAQTLHDPNWTVVGNGDYNGDGRSDILIGNADTGGLIEYQMNGSASLAASWLATPGAGFTVAGDGAAAAYKAAHDFNGDGKSDLLMRSTSTGSVLDYQMNGATVTASAWMPSPGADWFVVGTGDYNSDGKSDLLFRNNTTGGLIEFQMNGGTVIGSAWVNSPGASFQVVGGGDFNGDGKGDILFRNAAGSVLEYQMNGTAITSSAWMPSPGADWTVAGTGDYNGDGKSDLLFRNSTTGGLIEFQMNGSTIVSSAWIATPGSGFQVVGSGDYNGDGKSDILFRNSTSGGLLMHQMNGFAVSNAAWTPTILNPNWNVVGNDDYNGDGKADIVMRDSGTGGTLQYLMNGAAVANAAWMPNPGAEWVLA